MTTQAERIKVKVSEPPRLRGLSLAREGASMAENAAKTLAAAAWALSDGVSALLVCTVLVMSARVFVLASFGATPRRNEGPTHEAVQELEKAIAALVEEVDGMLAEGIFEDLATVQEADVAHAVWMLGLAQTDLALYRSGGSRPAVMPLEGSPLSKGGAR